MGYLLERIKEKLADSRFAQDVSTADRIRDIHRQWKEKLEAQMIVVEAGLINPTAAKKKRKQKVKCDPAWAKAKTLCRFNVEDVRKAKELRTRPRKLNKNISNLGHPLESTGKSVDSRVV